MQEYERCADALDVLIQEIGKDSAGTFSEADTRVKIIDRILTGVLGWPEDGPHIRREEHVHLGYIDYTLLTNSAGLLVEAKRIGTTFQLPESVTYSREFSVKNLLHKQPDLMEMYNQVTRYAHERGVRFCALTNGPQWLVFPGVRIDNMHIRGSKVIAFNGLEQVHDHFVAFWNLLSFKAVGQGGLERQIGGPAETTEPSYVINTETRLNIGYDRNQLSAPLEELLPKFFGELIGQADTEMLKRCFVMEEPFSSAVDTERANDRVDIPGKSLTQSGRIHRFHTLGQVSVSLENQMRMCLDESFRTYFQLLVGRVGTGKTTFLQYHFNVRIQAQLENHFKVYMDYRDVSDGTDLEQFFEQSIWDMVTKHSKFSTLTTPSMLRQIFKKDVEFLTTGPLANLKDTNPSRFEEKVDEHLLKEFSSKRLFLQKMATFLCQNDYARFVLIFDNVDQLPADLQDKIIRFAYSKTKQFHSFTIVCMWEETYIASKRGQRALATIRTVPVQIERQSTTSVLAKRLEYLIEQIKADRVSLALLDRSVCSSDEFCQYISLILSSLTRYDRKVRRFLEVVAHGNIRRALETFSQFLIAGSLESEKILAAMRANANYLIPFHEFVKCSMLQSKRFYSERTSNILNVFTIGDIERPSHFTRLRLLRWLHYRRHASSPLGVGFVSLRDLEHAFLQIGTSERDVNDSLARLTEGMLIENDIRAQAALDAVKAVRITASGRYYLHRLCNEFAYIDLVMQDTPIYDKDVYTTLDSLCNSADLEVRFDRCRIFLDYLKDQENEEVMSIEKLGNDSVLHQPFVGSIYEKVEKTISYIANRFDMHQP